MTLPPYHLTTPTPTPTPTSFACSRSRLLLAAWCLVLGRLSFLVTSSRAGRYSFLFPISISHPPSPLQSSPSCPSLLSLFIPSPFPPTSLRSQFVAHLSCIYPTLRSACRP
ncbi:hypothetical protein EV356DRAFT_151201 [Viridothelium virens]|uniref:Uncharacterized protein n=1 Tax=Viridothelium virens TaxID=1048519 RepID=A0A6A6H8K2_VIRVR|nr:hypothetical protein EV356DRAFT_151201 [Viridothelium virens]